MPRVLAAAALTLLGSLATLCPCPAADWPQWMGPNRDAVWTETGILKAFPKDGPKVLWRAPVSAGYAGPAVAGGKVFVADRVLGVRAMNPADPFDTKTRVPGVERLLCLDAKTGKELWKHEYDCAYQISYPAGPRCTPTVADGKVYLLGAMGDLHCLAADTGAVVWAKNLPKDYDAKVPTWGYCGHPLVYKDLVICLAGGDGSVAVALDAATGREKWKALTAREIGYCPPTLVHVAGRDQLVIWHAQAINGLDPLTGRVLWSFGLEPMFGMSIMAPRVSGDRLFAAGIGGAGLVLKFDEKGEPAVVWHEATDKAKGMTPKPRGLYPVNMTPFVEGGLVYGVDQPGMLRAVELDTGKKLWFTFKPVLGRDEAEDFKGGGSGTAFLVKNGDRFFLFNELGELAIAKLSRDRYEEVGRAKVVEPTGAAFGRKVVWSHPAFADRCAFVRNDKELVCVSLAE
ncbi:outer membrane protein assembly factor BamB family protein [Gemmata sp.]|uniref:PQQ-binding-like beta-propeller repeat protein n=1 Tax=Gemmata sp. TaxID=1914242 RepID=UPI003F725C32